MASPCPDGEQLESLSQVSRKESSSWPGHLFPLFRFSPSPVTQCFGARRGNNSNRSHPHPHPFFLWKSHVFSWVFCPEGRVIARTLDWPLKRRNWLDRAAFSLSLHLSLYLSPLVDTDAPDVPTGRFPAGASPSPDGDGGASPDALPLMLPSGRRVAMIRRASPRSCRMMRRRKKKNEVRPLIHPPCLLSLSLSLVSLIPS